MPAYRMFGPTVPLSAPVSIAMMMVSGIAEATSDRRAYMGKTPKIVQVPAAGS